MVAASCRTHHFRQTEVVLWKMKTETEENEPLSSRGPTESSTIGQSSGQRRERQQAEEDENFLKTDVELNERLGFVIGYLISSISHDLDEYIAWGIPYLEICLEALKLEKPLLQQIQETFRGSISTGFSFAFDSLDDNWTYIHPMESYLNQMALNLQKWNETEIVTVILTTFAESARRCNYDARVKLLSRRILSMYCIPEDGPSLLLALVPQVTSNGCVDELAGSFPMALERRHRDPHSLELFQAWKIGIAATIGGALMFCVGGLTAPQIISSIIAMLGGTSTTSALLVNMTQILVTYGPSTLTSSFTTLGAGMSSWKMSHRIQTIREFDFDPLQPPHVQHLSESVANIDLTSSGQSSRGIYLLVSGSHSEATEERMMWGADTFRESYLTSMMATQSTDCDLNLSLDLEKSWEHLDHLSSYWSDGWWRRIIDPSREYEAYVLHWERSELHRLHHTQQHFFLDKGFTLATEELLKLASPILSAASLPITLMERVAEIDCPWLVVMDRAKQAGKLLAQHILETAEHSLKTRAAITPMSLIGYGMGARVIFHCLQDLAQSGLSGRGIIETVVLIGSPIGLHSNEWLAARSVVVDRLVNCYNTKDWLLALLYRYRSWEVGVAGLQPVDLSSEGSSLSSDSKETLAGPSSTGWVSNTSRTIENIDISDLMVSSHSDYGASLEGILDRVFSPATRIVSHF
jgi:hypothetical protein